MTPRQLIERTSLGSLAAIANACGVSRQAVHRWKRIPAKCCPAIEAITGIRCEELRDDVEFVREPPVTGTVVKYCVRIKKKDD